MRRPFSDNFVAIHSVKFNLGNKAPLVLSVILNDSISTSAMVDSGATSLFIDFDFLKKNNLKPQRKKYPEILRVVDGRESSGGAISHEIELDLLLGEHFERTVFQVTKLSDYPIILGKAWLDRHNPSIHWSSNSISFLSKFCSSSCLKTLGSEPSNKNCPDTCPSPVSLSFCSDLVKQDNHQVFAVSSKDIQEYHLNFMSLYPCL